MAVFVQPDAGSAKETWRKVADTFRKRYPKLAALMDDAEADVLAYLAFPREDWRQTALTRRLATSLPWSSLTTGNRSS